MLAPDVELSGCGKDGVEMGADGDGWGFGCARARFGVLGDSGSGAKGGAGGEQVANCVNGCAEAEEIETLAQPTGAGLLGKRRRGKRGDGELKFGDLALVSGKPVEEPMDARVGAEAFDIIRERGWAECARTSSESRDGMAWQK